MLVQGKFQQSKDFTFLYKIKGRLMCAFTLYLVGGIIGRMENNGWKMVWKTAIFTVWEAKENREDGKSGRKFSSRTHQFFPSQIRRKTALNMKLHKCPLPPTLLTNTTAVLELSKKKKKTRESELEKKRKSAGEFFY